MELSVVSPCYGAPTLLRQLVKEITEAVAPLTESYEILLVEDGSPDNSRDIIREICAQDPHVKGIFLSRNFGQQSALNAGYDQAQGNYVVTLDCDLQNPPAQIRDLYLKAKEGYDIVYATRRNRPDSFFMTQGSHVFNKLMGFLTDTRQDESVAEFTCKPLLRYPERFVLLSADRTFHAVRAVEDIFTLFVHVLENLLMSVDESLVLDPLLGNIGLLEFDVLLNVIKRLDVVHHCQHFRAVG